MPRDIAVLNQSIIEKILPYAPEPGNWETPIEGFFVYRRDWNILPENRLFPPSVTIVLQGEHKTFFGEHEYHYQAGDCIVKSMDLMSVNYVAKTIPEKPFFSVSLRFDRYLTAQLMAEISEEAAYNGRDFPNVSVEKASLEVLEAFDRLASLLDRPEDIPVLAPLIVKEIHYRILKGSQGELLRQVNTVGTCSNQIARALLWLREHFREPLSVERLAAELNMAASTFYRHFKAVTQTSPIQFQKKIRLLEAQRLIIVGKKYVATAAAMVGYENARQFSQDYKRYFGRLPSDDRNITKKLNGLIGLESYEKAKILPKKEDGPA